MLVSERSSKKKNGLKEWKLGISIPGVSMVRRYVIRGSENTNMSKENVIPLPHCSNVVP
jgi:hypothetical protein